MPVTCTKASPAGWAMSEGPIDRMSSCPVPSGPSSMSPPGAGVGQVRLARRGALAHGDDVDAPHVDVDVARPLGRHQVTTPVGEAGRNRVESPVARRRAHNAVDLRDLGAPLVGAHPLSLDGEDRRVERSVGLE